MGAKFAEQLRDLRHRIDSTAPHYIRCLKPNDELLPDEFDPKQIVEQLRYSGVLEAVRVSRAGYPTRYPHGQFMSRYYMLGDLGQDGTKRNKDMIQLVKFIAKHVWEADIKKIQARDVLAQSQMQARQVRRHVAVYDVVMICIINNHLICSLVSFALGIWKVSQEEIGRTPSCYEEEKEDECSEQHRNS